MYHLRVPQTAEELESYYQFRWEMLRKPLHQPKGSERDAWDAMAHHQMVVDEEGNLVAVGRLYINAENEASIRFMAVHPSVQDKGLGTLMAMTWSPSRVRKGLSGLPAARAKMRWNFSPSSDLSIRGDHHPDHHADPSFSDDQTGRVAGRYFAPRRLVRTAPAGVVSAYSAE